MGRTRSIIVLALGAATLVVIGMVMWPLFVLLPTAAMRALILAPLYSLFADTLLRRVGFPGALTLFGLVLGVILSFFSPLMLPVSVLGAGGAELAGWLLGLRTKDSWQKQPSIRKLTAALFPALQFPMMLMALAYLAGQPLTSFLTNPLLILLFTGLGIALGYGGCALGEQIARRLPRAA